MLFQNRNSTTVDFHIFLGGGVIKTVQNKLITTDLPLEEELKF